MEKNEGGDGEGFEWWVVNEGWKPVREPRVKAEEKKQ